MRAKFWESARRAAHGRPRCAPWPRGDAGEPRGGGAMARRDADPTLPALQRPFKKSKRAFWEERSAGSKARVKTF